MNIIKNLYHKYFDLSLKDRSILTSKLSILYQLISASTKLVLGILTSQIFYYYCRYLFGWYFYY